MNKVIKYLILVLFLSGTYSINISAQSCGFGCLGLSGIYGGYTVQNYDAKNLTDFVKSQLSDDIESPDYGQGTGFKVGANIFRAKFDGFFISAKGFYQFLEENYQVEVNTQFVDNEKYEFSSNYFGFGLDFGFDIVNLISLKLVEGGLTFHDAEFRVTTTLKDDAVSINETSLKYTNDKLKIGYYVGTGLIIHLIQDYVSIEGTAFYSIYDINNLSRETISGSVAGLLPQGQKTISSGGFGATVQLNIGFPF